MGIALIAPIGGKSRRPQQIGRKGLSNTAGIVRGETLSDEKPMGLVVLGVVPGNYVATT